MTTFRCCICGDHFTPAYPRPYPAFPGYCDDCGWLEEVTRPGDSLETKIRDLKIGGSLFFPVTESDPRPWETLRAEIKRPRWAYLSGGLCAHPVQENDYYVNDQGLIALETEDGARLFKSLTFEELSLGMGLKKPVQWADFSDEESMAG